MFIYFDFPIFRLTLASYLHSSLALSLMNIYLRTFISFLLDVWCLVLFIICNNFLPPVYRPLSTDPHFESCKITSMALALEMLVAAGSVHWPAHSTLHKGKRERKNSFTILSSYQFHTQYTPCYLLTQQRSSNGNHPQNLTHTHPPSLVSSTLKINVCNNYRIWP